jgi:hypothetical protein
VREEREGRREKGRRKSSWIIDYLFSNLFLVFGRHGFKHVVFSTNQEWDCILKMQMLKIIGVTKVPLTIK